MYCSFILIILSCNEKNKIEAFSELNVTININLTDGEYSEDTLGNYALGLINTKQKELPLYDSLPFNLKFGYSKSNIYKIFNDLKLSFKIIDSGIFSTTTFIQKDEILFEVITIFKFNNQFLNHIDQEIFVNGEHYKRIYNQTDLTNYNKVVNFNFSDWENVKYNVYSKTDILFNEYLNLFKSKYGEPNYNFIGIDYNERVRKYNDYRHMWLKNGVLINYYKYLAVDYKYIELPFNFNTLKFQIGRIEFSSVSDYLSDYRNNYNATVIIDSSFFDSKPKPILGL